MATTEEFKNGGSTSYPFSIEYIKASDIKIKVDGTALTYTTNASPASGQYKVVSTTATLGATAAAGTGNVHIYRETDLETAAATFAAGSSIRAADLNACHDMVRLASQEQNQKVLTTDLVDSVITTAKIVDGTIVNADISGSAAIAQSKIATGNLPSGVTVNSANIVDGSIVNADVNNSAAIAGTKISPNFGSQVVQTSGNIVVGGTVDGRDIATDGTKLDGIEAAATIDQTAAEIKTLLQSDKLTDSEIATGTLDNRYYTETQLDGGSLDTRYYTETELNAGQLDNRYFTETEISNGAADTRYYTETELDAGQLDNRYYTETEAEALFLRQDSSETIASGVTWSNADNKVATTAAINARIIDLVDDIGGFTVIANETSFPNTNPQGSTGQAAIMSIGALSQAYTPSGTTVSITNGTVGNSTVTITGVPSVLPIGFGILVESTSTLNTYTFHRLVPKATEVTTVAGSITNINNCGNNLADIENFADLYQISTSAPTTRADGTALTTGDLWFDSSSNQVMMVYDGSSGDGFSAITPSQSTITAINSVSGHVTFQEDLGLITNAVNTGSGNNSINTVGAAITNVNTTATNIANVNTVAGAIANVNTTAGSIANVNTVGGAIANVNRYADEYSIQSSSPSSPQAGDLWFSTTSNVLNFYNGTAWVGIAPGIAGLINDASPQLANHLDCNDKNLTEVGTVSGNNLQLDFGTL